VPQNALQRSRFSTEPAVHVYLSTQQPQRERRCRCFDGERARCREIERGDATSPSRPSAPVTTPGRASRARHPLPLKNIHHWRSSGAGARRPKKYRKYFTGFLSVWQSRRRRLAATVGMSKNPTICRRGSPTPASARQASSRARIYCLVPRRFLSAAGQGGRERDARLVRQIAGTRRDHDPNSEAA
jgi:hypothetical protein